MTVRGLVLKSFDLVFDRVPTDKIKSCLISSTRYLVSWTIAAVDKLLEYRSELFKKGFTIYYFAKRDADKKICEMITRLSVLLIFSDIFGTQIFYLRELYGSPATPPMHIALPSKYIILLNNSRS